MAGYAEPTGDVPAGFRIYKRSHSPYERWMEEQEIPVFRGIGVHDTRDLELGQWRRRNARGCLLDLHGLEGVKGMYVLEIPSGGMTTPEKHVYDEFFIVIEGHGSTEVRDGNGREHLFEWQPGSLFTIPINSTYRLVNATSERVLVIAANNAPPVMNIFQSHSFVFDNDWTFDERYAMTDDFFKAKWELETDPVRGRAAIRSNVFPDVVGCELPLDNQRAPGYRRIQPRFHGFIADSGTGGFVAQYPSGRYSKGHYHSSGAVLVCLRGRGYTFSWQTSLGPTPWRDGHGAQVNMVEYVPGGLVAAAPGGGNWFHQHFGIAPDPLRVANFWGGPNGRWSVPDEGGEGDEVKAGNIFGIREGGHTILYHEEDPYIRKYYEERLRGEGLAMTMPTSAFEGPGPG